jgi:hypothetical protein
MSGVHLEGNGPPTIFIDSLAPAATVSGVVTVSGWAIDNTTTIGTAIGNVQVIVDGAIVGAAIYGTGRPDVCAVFPGRPGCPNVGFTYQLNTASLSAGTHTLTVVATDTDSPPASGSYSISIKVSSAQAPPPTVFIDSLAPNATVSGVVTVSGWAIDNTTTIGSVQILVDGAVIGAATYGSGRADVCAAYPGRPGCPNVGFAYQLNTAALSPGTHTLGVVATDTSSPPVSGSYSISIKVSSAQTPPVVYIDSLAPGATVSGTVTVSGWAIDNTTTIGTAISSVQVQVDGVAVGNAVYGTARSDVCAVYPGRPGCPNVGFAYQLNTGALSAGTHTLGVIATDTDSPPQMGSFLLTVKVVVPLMTLTLAGPSTCRQGQTCNYTASGGTPPYSYSLMGGSVGSINPGSGAYTAPAHIVPKQVINGCQGMPNNSIFNTRIDSLPVHPNNTLWMSNVDTGMNYLSGYAGGDRISGSTVLSTDPPLLMNFVYSPNPPGGTNFIFQPFPDRVSQAGAAWTPPSNIPGVDNHFLTTYRDTCQEQDVYKLYQNGAYPPYPLSNSAAGVLYSLELNQLPSYGTDAAGLPFGPLMVHEEELIAAAAGDLDAIKHAARLTLDARSLAGAERIWPAQTVASGGFCQGPPSIYGSAWPNISGNGTTTVTTTAGFEFRPTWPAGMIVTLDAVNYTIVSVAGNGLSMVLSSAVPAGSHAMTTPDTNCPPYGTRFRLKASYVWPSTSYAPNCDTACKNLIQAIIRQQQRYGMFLADVGTSWGFENDGGLVNYAMGIVVQHLNCNVANCQFDGLIGNASNYEIVDESSLQTSQTQGTPDPTWTEAKLNNGYVIPDDAAVIQVTDSASHIGYWSVSLQGVAVGVQHPNEVVMAGAAPFQLAPWVTGTSNPGYSCSLSPSGPGYGTITGGCLYSPPVANAVATLTTTTVTVTANADPAATKAVIIQIVPLSSDGKLHISLGKAYPSATYTDNNGIVWWNDMAQGLPMNLFPDDGSISSPYGQVWSNYPGTDAFALSAPRLYDTLLSGYNDHHFRIHVPNGTVTGTVLPANTGASAPNIVGFSFDCNGIPAVGQTDLFDFTGGLFVGRPLSCTQAVTNGLLHMVVRLQGVNLGAHDGCSTPCYAATNPGFGNLAAGLVVSLGQ